MEKKVKCCAFPRNGMIKLWRIMRLTFLIVLVGLLEVSASVYSQQTKLSMNLKDVTLKDAFREIEDCSNFVFFYNADQVQLDQRVSLNVNNEGIDEILSNLLENKGITYKVIDRRIVLYPRDLQSPFVDQQSLTVKGKVIDSAGSSLPGVTVVLKGTTQGTITDTNGNYSLGNVPSGGTLVFSFVGMKTQEIPITGKAIIDVTMAEESVGIEEVVAIGYGTMKKANLTGAVNQVSAEVLESKAVGNVGQAIQGAIPNLNVSFENGSPNTNAKLNVRGGTSFSGNSFTVGSPLILVDGVEQADVFNLTNPEDIESITVLKDASSAAIYGARAAFGVVLVTTKKGKKDEKVTVTYNTSYQISRPVATPDLLDSYESQLALNNGKLLAGQSVNTFDENILQWKKEYMDNPETAPVYKMNGNSIVWVGNFDPYDIAVRDWAPTHRHTLTARGGTEKVSYYASIGYQNQEGIYNFNTDIHNRYTALINLSTKLNERFSVDYKVSFNQTDYVEPYNNPGIGGWWFALSLGGSSGGATSTPMKTADDAPIPGAYTDTALSYMDYGASDKRKQGSIVLRVAPTLNLMKGLNLKSDFTYEQHHNLLNSFVSQLDRVYGTWDELVPSPHTNPTKVYKSRYNRESFTFNIYGDYSKTIGDFHNVKAVAGFNQEWMQDDELWGQGEDILTPTIPYVSQTLGTKTTGDTGSEWAIRGAFFRLQYNFKEKYLFEMNGRYDGTSRFPTDTRYAFFPSFSAGWRISEESFAQGIKNVVSNLKFRGNYGALGNQNVANYIFYPSYSTTSRVNYIFNDKRPMGINPPGLVSNDLTWETAKTIDFGIDLTLLNKLDFTFDWYNRTTSDIVVAGDKFPAVLGTGAPTKNSGEMKTVGWEFTANWRDKLKNGFTYDIGLVLSDFQSEITKFDGNPNNVLSSLYAGQKMGEIWGFETEGLFQSLDEIASAPSQSKISGEEWRPGDVRYKNLDDDDSEIYIGANTAEDPGDRKIIGNSTPRYSFGVTMNGAWKGFDLNLFWQGVGKRDVWTDNTFLWGQISNNRFQGTKTVYEDSWTPTRTDAFWPGYRPFGGNMQVQTRYLLDASYLRLKSLTLGYIVPKSLTQKIGIQKARIYFAGQNLWEKTKVPKTLDPELVDITYPIMRSYSLGLQITF